MEKLDYAFFVDFDGTIASIDVCEAMVNTFARNGWQEINKKWESKELSTSECARETLKLFKTNNIKDLLSLAEKAKIDPGFHDFLAYCEERRFPVTILSDGYSFYIEHLLNREGLKLPYYANKMLFTPGLDIETPYSSFSCDLCGVCKLELMKKLKKPNQKAVYIGDSYSDFCPAKSADIVFAKSRLYKYCLEEGKAAYSFNSFNQILNKLIEIIEGGLN